MTSKLDQLSGWLKERKITEVECMIADLTGIARGKIAPTIVSHNAANIDKFSPTPEQRAAARAKWKLDGSVVCGYLGAFVPWHAIDQFVYRIADRLKAADATAGEKSAKVCTACQRVSSPVSRPGIAGSVGRSSKETVRPRRWQRRRASLAVIFSSHRGSFSFSRS